METGFHISNCAAENQVKFSTCTLLGAALTWWNFHELALMCRRMIPEESDEVEKYVGGLPDMIQGNVMSARPKIMQEEIELANDLIDQKVRIYAERQAKNKMKFDNNNQAQQQLPKRQIMAQAYAAGTGEGRSMLELFHGATSACFTTMARALQRHYKSDCPKLKNRNHRNKAEATEARGMVYALGGGETNQDLDDMEDDINA
uniref:Reverse transcriptase domain-containing protein n=1 Tax=Tanacetum cinerariifolium TaxID=118510 RepID=A0A6L2KG28_TANCI|nr:hypothetical protein [Tanacetum cinerariifolium]